MSIVVHFEAPGMSQQQYDQIVKELDAKGLGTPDGRLYHVAWNTPDGWRVLDVFESEDKLRKFADALMPIIDSVGATPPEPQIFPAHNVIKG